MRFDSYSTVQKFVVSKIFLKDVFYFHQSCIYLIKNTVKTVKYYYNLKWLFSVWIYFKM